jgi:NAD(P)-dependent dehydrogenase (short-subunit alcohol dehydrogenase family)
MAMSDELKGRTALITGGAKRIGRETALALSARGINVVIYVDGGRNLHEYSNGSHPH